MLDVKLREIAQRVKAAREAVGLSVEQMAEKVDLSVDEYQGFESGANDFNFTFIYKCALACGIEIADVLEGESPHLTAYDVTRAGEGLPITRRAGFKYLGIAPMFKHKLAEPFCVTVPYSRQAEENDIPTSTHYGQELDIVISGSLKIKVGDNTEVLNAGDSIYYTSTMPHGMVAVGGKDCVMYAVVMNPSAHAAPYKSPEESSNEITATDLAGLKDPVYEEFIETESDSNGVLQKIDFKNEDRFNFAFDCVDKIAEKDPARLAMVHLSRDKEERRFTFADMKKASAQTANYFASLGIQKGDRVMLVLRRHYQFWFAMLGLHKLGAIAIPATNQLVQHDFEYRYNKAGVKAIVCTADGDVSTQAELAANNCESLKIKVIVDGKREGWHCFDEEFDRCGDTFERTADTACGDDTMLMLFTSGTTGYPSIAAHSYKYALGHFITAKYWHNIDPNGLHLTISDTGWGKALWGKLYGQWLCEAATFVYDFDRFSPEDLLPLFAKYNITTFCAPPTMYRFFIKEDLSKYDLSSIKYATTAGEALNPEVFSQFYKATGLKIMEGFGQTETTLSIGNLVGTTSKIGSMGRPTPLYDVVLLDQDGNECKNGETGEICVRTPDGKAPCGLFKGYYNDDEKTKSVWHDGFYHTGDQATRDEDGYYWYVGRIDDVIKSSGYRIGPFEIESVIMELPYVLECAITAVPDAVRGQIVKATIVLTRGTVGTDELKKEIQNYVKTHTAPYKYPRIVEFVDELPKTISGKIRRVEIRQNDAK